MTTTTTMYIFCSNVIFSTWTDDAIYVCMYFYAGFFMRSHADPIYGLPFCMFCLDLLLCRYQ